MNIEIKKVISKRDFRSFINLPAKIHKEHENWVPPIYIDDRTFFNPKKNEAFSFSDTIMLLAIQNNAVTGRIMGIINHKYNTAHQLKEGRFCFLETYNDFSVAKTLINYIESWTKDKGMDLLVGPLGFSDKDPQGFLVDGFDEPNVIATNCNFPYLVDFITKEGYLKKTDLVVYKLDIPETLPEFYLKIYERVSNSNKSLRVLNFSTKRQLKSYVKPVLTLMNETFKEIYAFSPLSEKEMNEFASRYLIVLDPRFIKVIENENKEVIAFVLAMPDISDGIKKCKGRLIPFGLFHVLRAQKNTKQLNLLLGAIRSDYQNIGLDTMLGVSMLKEAQKAGLEYIDSHLELESNTKMRAEFEKMGGIIYKRYRIFEKRL